MPAIELTKSTAIKTDITAIFLFILPLFRATCIRLTLVVLIGFLNYLLEQLDFRYLTITATENTERSKGRIIKAGYLGTDGVGDVDGIEVGVEALGLGVA